MAERIRELARPQGCSRTLFRLPLGLYRFGLGWLLGSRFVHLTHIGRKSGKARHTVLEVLRSESNRSMIYVVSAWGERADWLQNVRANPEVVVQMGVRRWPARAHVLTKEDSEYELGLYAAKHPAAARGLARLLGYRLEKLEDFSALAQDMCVVALTRTSYEGKH
jgi:deazaflavin-dependent oxidoreductase (nitroreductase family)